MIVKMGYNCRLQEYGGERGGWGVGWGGVGVLSDYQVQWSSQISKLNETYPNTITNPPPNAWLSRRFCAATAAFPTSRRVYGGLPWLCNINRLSSAIWTLRHDAMFQFRRWLDHKSMTQTRYWYHLGWQNHTMMFWRSCIHGWKNEQHCGLGLTRKRLNVFWLCINLISGGY